MDHEIQHLRLCFIWTRTFFDLFEHHAAAGYPYGFFARVTAYKSKFEELRSVVHPGEGLTLPWRRTRACSFWKHYFKEKPPWGVSPNLAWSKYLVPFRKRLKSRISAPWLTGKRAVTLEGFFYRHGVAAVITVRVRDSASLDEAVKRALQARYKKDYDVKWGDGSQGLYSLGGLAEYTLDSFCEDALGSGGHKGRGFSGDPFSIAAVIQGGSDYKDQPVEQGNEIHKALEALVTWNETWSGASPPQLEEKKLPMKNEQGNHYLYGDRQGRAVWFPKLFTPPTDGSRRYALGWYSRNLLLASVQTASLGAFLTYTADRLKEGASIPKPQKDWARDAIKALDRLSQGQNTYRTWSTHAQIEQNGFLDAISYLKPKL